MQYIILILNLLFCKSQGGGHLNSLADAAYRPQSGANTNLAMNYLPERRGGMLKNHSAMSGSPPNSHGGKSVGKGGFGSYGGQGGFGGGQGGGFGSNAGGFGYGGNNIPGGRKGAANKAAQRAARARRNAGHTPAGAMMNAAAMGDPRAQAAMMDAANKSGYGGGGRKPPFGRSPAEQEMRRQAAAGNPAAQDMLNRARGGGNGGPGNSLAAAANQGARLGAAAGREAAKRGASPEEAAEMAANAAASGASPSQAAAMAAGGSGGGGGRPPSGAGGSGGGRGRPPFGAGAAGGGGSGGGGGEHIPDDPPLNSPDEMLMEDALAGGPLSQERQRQKAREAGASAKAAETRAAQKQAMRPMSAAVRDATKKAIAQQEAMEELQNQRDSRVNPDNVNQMGRNPLSDAVAATAGAEAEADDLLADMPPSRMKAAMKAKEVSKKVGDAAAKEAEALAASNPDVTPAEAKMAGAEAAEKAEKAVEEAAKKEAEIDRDSFDREAARQAGDQAAADFAAEHPDSSPSQQNRAGAAAAAEKQAQQAQERATENAAANAAEEAGLPVEAAGAAAAEAAGAAAAAGRGGSGGGRGGSGAMQAAAEQGAAEGRAMGKGRKRRAANDAMQNAMGAVMAAEEAESRDKTPKALQRAAAEGAAEGMAAAMDAKDVGDMAAAAGQGAAEGVAAAQQAKAAERQHQQNKKMKDPQMRRAGAEGAEQGIAGAKAAKEAALTGKDPVTAAAKAMKKEAAMQDVAKDPETVAAVQQELEEEAEALEKMAKRDPKAAIQKSLLSGESPDKARRMGESVAGKNAIDDAKAFIDRTKPMLAAEQALEEACDSAEAARKHGFIPQEEAEMKIEEALVKGTQAAEQAAIDRQYSDEGLGIIATVPDDADKVSIEKSSLKLPLKSFVDVEAKNEEEAVALARQTELKEALRNKVTNKDIESPLNVIRGEDGFFNIPESAKELEIKEGTVIYPESARESMRNAGLDTSKLEHKYNTGQRSDIPLGRGYFTADASDMKMTLPSPANPSPSKALIGEKGTLDTSYAEGLEINKGTLRETPWSDFAKTTRPTLHAGIKKKPYLSKADEQMLKKAIATKELLQNTRTEVLRNPNGEDYVELTPPYGVSEKVSVEDAIVNLNSPPKGLKDTGQDGVGLLQGTDTTGFAVSDDMQGNVSMNIADKPDFVGSIEDQVIGNSFGNAAISGTAKDTMTTVNAFTGEIDQDKKGLVTSDEEKPKISGQEATTEMVKSNLLENSASKAETLGISESTYINAVNSIPPAVFESMTEYALHPTSSTLKSHFEKSVLTVLSTLLPNKGPQLSESIFTSIKTLSGLPNPKNLVQAPVKEITAIVHNGNNPKESPKIEKIFVKKANATRVDPAYVPKPEMMKEKPGVSRKPELDLTPEILATRPRAAQVVGISKVDSKYVPARTADTRNIHIIDSKSEPPNAPNTQISSSTATNKPKPNQTETTTTTTNRYVPKTGNKPAPSTSTTVLGVSPANNQPRPIGQR